MQAEKQLILTPINPFTPRQREVIECVLKGLSQKEIAVELGVTVRTVKNFLYGQVPDYVDFEEASRRELGIFGQVERLTGKRPRNRAELIMKLMGDVILEREVILGEEEITC